MDDNTLCIWYHILRDIQVSYNMKLHGWVVVQHFFDSRLDELKILIVADGAREIADFDSVVCAKVFLQELRANRNQFAGRQIPIQ